MDPGKWRKRLRELQCQRRKRAGSVELSIPIEALSLPHQKSNQFQKALNIILSLVQHESRLLARKTHCKIILVDCLRVASLTSSLGKLGKKVSSFSKKAARRAENVLIIIIATLREALKILFIENARQFSSESNYSL